MPDDNRHKAMLFDNPTEIPVTLGILPAVWMKYRDQLNELARDFPELFGADAQYKTDYDTLYGKFTKGDHVDAWGCVWSNVIPGMTAIVTAHPVPHRSDVRSLLAPTENEGLPHGFMYLRLADLRGFEELMLDFAEDAPELGVLIRTVLEYNLRQAQIKVNEIGDSGSIVYLGDDLGMQHALPMHPSHWRRHLKECYRSIFRIFIDHGHYVYFHTDGHVIEIIPDLIECGMSVINPQSGSNQLSELAAICKGRVCVDIDLDRQLFPFASSSQLEEHVHEAVESLITPQGGLWMTAHIDQSVPIHNIRTICELLVKYRRISGQSMR